MLLLSKKVFQKALFEPNGTIREGGVFGISIGSQSGEIAPVLSRLKFSRGSKSVLQYCPDDIFAESSHSEVYTRQNWPSGMICVLYKDDRVTTIYWSLDLIYL